MIPYPLYKKSNLEIAYKYNQLLMTDCMKKLEDSNVI